MGDFNPRSPAVLGSEFQPRSAELVTLDSALTAVAMRVRGTAATVARVHNYLQDVQGNPGLAVELVDTLTPDITEEVFFPGTDANNRVTAWSKYPSGTASYTEVDDRYSTTDWLHNTLANGQFQGMPLWFSGNNAGALAGKRVLSVAVGCHFHNTLVAGNNPTCTLEALLRLNGDTHLARPVNPRTRATSVTWNPLGEWPLNPATGLPWTVAEVDDILDAADADTFGVKVTGRLAAQGFRVHGLWLTVTVCDENRLGYYYQGGQPRTGWNELTLSSTAAMTANEAVWLVISAPLAATGDFVRLARLIDRDLVEDHNPAGTGEHRATYALTLATPGGAATRAVHRPRAMLPALLDTGSIHGQSQPYATVQAIPTHADTPGPFGQQITGTAGTDYAGIMAPVGWANPNTGPDQPLVFEVRSGAGAFAGGGTLHATATLDPADTLNPNGARQVIPFDQAFASAALQYVVLVSSAAAPGRAWNVWRSDTRSDDLGAGTTDTELHGATQGGSTDRYLVGSTGLLDARWDLNVALAAAPDAPANLTATADGGT